MPKYRITIPGFMENPNGADWYPDEYVVLDMTEDELHAYIVEHEANNHAAWLLRQRAPGWYDSDGADGKIPRAVWNKIDLDDLTGMCERWCRGVEIVEDYQLPSDIFERAKIQGKNLSTHMVTKAVRNIQDEKKRAAAEKETLERAMLASLLRQYGNPNES